MVYNMGTSDHPIGELFERVNDGKYHIVRFTRNGANSTIQVDNAMMQTKNPRGRCAPSDSNINCMIEISKYIVTMLTSVKGLGGAWMHVDREVLYLLTSTDSCRQ